MLQEFMANLAAQTAGQSTPGALPGQLTIDEAAKRNAETNWKKWQGSLESDAMLESAEKTIRDSGVEVEDRKLEIKKWESWIADEKALLKQYEDEKNEAMAQIARDNIKSYDEILKTARQRLNQATADYNKAKITKSKKGEVPPFNPVSGPASLSGQIGK